MAEKNSNIDLSDTQIEFPADTFNKIVNPFTPKNFGSGDLFYHKDLIKKIKNIFNTQPGKRIIILQGNAGTGKTSTLKYIEKAPHTLGKNYIPIYLESTNYLKKNIDEISFAIYKDIIEQLKGRGHQIQEPDFFKERRKKDSTNTFELILLTFEAHFEKDKIFIVIFDELDKLLENIEIKSISSLLQYFQQIKRKWSRYGLILSGDRRLINLTGDETINKFLKTAETINIEEALEDETIKTSITEPVKDQMTFDDKAIAGIIWYSGKNLYFQQLLCHHLVEYMNEAKRNHCLIRDVDQTVQRILEKNISQFGYAWEKKLSTNGRLIISALADNSVTEEKENHYTIKQNDLLDKIFGNTLDDQIEKIKNLGYIRSKKEDGFHGYPIRVPLYGKWIQKEQPFIKTLIQDIETIAGQIDLDLLIKEIEMTPPGKLTPFSKEELLDLTKKWGSLSNAISKSRTGVDKNQVESFFVDLCERLYFKIKEKPTAGQNHFIIDIENIDIGMLKEALCFIQDKAELRKEDIANITTQAAKYAQKAQTNLTLFFYLQKNTSVENLVKKTYLSLIPIDENDIKKIILSYDPLKIFKKIVLSKLSLKKVSPYITAGPATATFYGRSGTISQITGAPETSFAITGARKMGKSSLLHKIKENLPEGMDYIYMDLDAEFSNAKNYKTFFNSLKSEIERKIGIKVNFRKFLFGVDLSKLPKAIQELKEKEKRIIFIFDEIDGLIIFDKNHNFKLMRIFRTMAQKNYSQFIFAGFEELYHHARDIKNPLYNFCEEILLEPLDRDAALDLISVPMESIGVHYKDDDDRELILGYTARHPNLLQFFCKKLIEKVEDHKNVDDRRTILRKDIEELYDTSYENFVMNQVYMFDNLGKVNQLILLLLAEDYTNSKIYTEAEIRIKLEDEGITLSKNSIRLNHNLKNLVMRFILLEKTKSHYCFALPVFPEILNKKIDDYLKPKLIMEIKANV